MRLGNRRLSRVATGALLLCSGLLSARRASAQFPKDQPTRLPALGRSAVSDDDSTSLVVNPANLGFMPGAELRWTDCHRGLISDYLKAAGHDVVHIVSASEHEAHPYTGQARIVDGHLSYRGWL